MTSMRFFNQDKEECIFSNHELIPGVNFINILCSIFSYKSALHSFSLATFWL
jgi:hypothetical protein